MIRRSAHPALWAARALAGLLVLAPLLLLAPAARAQQRASADLGLASQTAFVRGAGTFTMRLDVDRVRLPQQLEMVVTVHRAVRSRSEFALTIDGDLLGTSIHSDRYPFDELDFDAAGAVPITVDPPSPLPGVYPVSVRLLDTDDDTVVASLVTHLIRVPDEPVEMPLSVAWVQQYGADPALQPDGTTAVDSAQLDELRTIAALLDAGVPLTIVPTPETIAALATLDDGTTTDALSTLLAEHQVLSTPFVDVDVNAIVGAGRTDDLARQRVVGDGTLHDVLGVDADTRSWSLLGAVTPAALAALAGLGVQRVVLDDAALVPLPSSATGGLTLARPFSVPVGGSDQLEAVAVDPALVSHLEERGDVLAAHHLLADLAVLHFDSPGTPRGVVIRPPDGWHPSDELLSTVFGALADAPLLQPVTLNELFVGVDPLADADGVLVERELAPASASPFGIATTELDRARAQIAGYGSLTGTSNPDLELLDRLVLVSETDDLRATTRRAYLAAVSARVAEPGTLVRVLGDRTYRLTAREGTIPLTLVNDNPFDVNVTLELTSDKLEFTKSGDLGRQRIEGLVLAAQSTTTEAVPVKARTSGAFPLRVVVRSPDGQLELGRTQITITSTVASGVGIVLSVGAALFLLLWWGSHWRTARRARRLVPSE